MFPGGKDSQLFGAGMLENIQGLGTTLGARNKILHLNSVAVPFRYLNIIRLTTMLSAL